MAIKHQKLVADLETTTDPKDVRAWAVCAVDIETTQTVFLDTSLESFIEWLKDKNTTCYFHNAKFDLEFVLSYILRNGWTYSEVMKEKTFKTLITDDGIFYAVTLCFEKLNKKYKKVTFYDSLKKLPFKVKNIAKAFQLPDRKGEIDYKKHRPIGYEITEEEKEYIVKDCRIVAQALKIQFDQGLTKMTNASDAINWYKDIIRKDQFELLYPTFPIELDSDLRQAYKGGFVYLKPEHQNKRGLEGITLDVNSLYPYVMYDRLLPYSYPFFFEGEPTDERFPLYIVRIRTRFELKPDHIPTIQIKGTSRFVPTEYLTSSKIYDKKNKDLIDEPVELTLTSVDLKLFLDQYDILEIEYVCGWYFKGKKGMFKDYIDYWIKEKVENTGPKRQLAKLMLNSLYGRFCLNPRVRNKLPYLDNKNVVKYKLAEPEERDPVYTPMGAFITAYSREKTIRSAQSVYDRFIYADTDSLHLIGHEIPENLYVHDSDLGAWKNEGIFCDSMYIRAKTYMETMLEESKDSLENYARLLGKATWIKREDDKLKYAINKVTCAGMPDNVKEEVTYDNFKLGTTFEGKLMPRRYVGGIILEETTFTIQ